MPRMREATRSGWNGSNASAFSPTPTNAIGRPITWRTDSAAPPRASPSILVRMTASMPTAWLNLSATVTASCPVIASTTSSPWCGLTSRLVARSPADFEGLLRDLADDGDVELGAERAELVLGGRAVGVGGGQDRMLA